MIDLLDQKKELKARSSPKAAPTNAPINIVGFVVVLFVVAVVELVVVAVVERVALLVVRRVVARYGGGVRRHSNGGGVHGDGGGVGC
ncbi:hypothetical protein HpKG24_13930 [Helicobacter pylori]